MSYYLGSGPRQAATIPFRRTGGLVSVCLITGATSGRWGIPKGTIERGSSAKETALQEAWEEAGLRGRIVGDVVGTYEYKKGGVLLTVAVYLMEVETAKDRWKEDNIRRRRWVPSSEAARMLEFHPAASVIERACTTLNSCDAVYNVHRGTRQPPTFAALLGNALNRLLGS